MIELRRLTNCCDHCDDNRQESYCLYSGGALLGTGLVGVHDRQLRQRAGQDPPSLFRSLNFSLYAARDHCGSSQSLPFLRHLVG